MSKLHIRKGDTVVVLTGDVKDKGKTGKVLKVLVDKNRAIVEALAHVLTTVFLPLSFIARIFFSSDTLIYGPFLSERLIIYSLFFVSSFDNILVGKLLRCTCLETLSIQALTGTWVTTGLTAFTTTHRVINRVHDNTTVVRTTAQPTRTTGLTGTLKSVVGVAYTTNSSFTSTQNLASFTRRELNHTITTLTRR
jgi:hypothetical protein